MNLLKLLNSNKTKNNTTTTTTMQPTMPIESVQCYNNEDEDDDDDDDDADSFIELELTLPNYDAKLVKLEKPAQQRPVFYKTDTDSDFSSKRASTTSSSSCEEATSYKAINRVDEDSTGDIRLRTVGNTQNRSPLSILKSTTIRLMNFRRKNGISESETESVFGISPSRSEKPHGGGKIFPVKFRRSNSNKSRLSTGDDLEEKSGVGKYLNLLSPLHYIKAAKRNGATEKVKEAEDFGESQAAKWWMSSSIDKAKEKREVIRIRSRFGIMDRCSLAKSGSIGCSRARRIDDSSEQRKDGIQSAILHCKLSLEIHRGTENVSCREYV